MDFKLNMGELEEVLTSLHKMKAKRCTELAKICEG